MVVFILNVIFNIQKYFLDYCKCDGETICLPCEIADIFNGQTTYKVYKKCIDLDVPFKVKENHHLQLNNLLEKHDHFLCKIK